MHTREDPLAWRDQVDWWTAPHLAYAAGLADAYQAGREDFAGELIPALKWMLAGVDQPVDEMTPEDVMFWVRLVTSDVKALMARHLRLLQVAEYRRAWREANRLPDPAPVAA